jgi:hypothetical protein
MNRRFAFLVILTAALALCRAEAQTPQTGDVLAVVLGEAQSSSNHARALILTNDNPGQSVTRSFPLSLEKLRGTYISFGADVRAEGVSQKPKPWNGIKVMAVISLPGGTQYPQPDLPVGTFDWKRATTRVFVPTNATSATLVLGLEQVSGKAWFDNARVTFVRRFTPVPAAPPDQPIYRGHDLPRLRGAMIAPQSMTEADLKVLAGDWGGNVVRWQLIRTGRSDGSVESYDKWLDSELARLDKGLVWAQQLGVKVVLDLHSPPGGDSVSGGYQAAVGGLWTDPKAQDKFLEVWKKMAARYKGDSRIWGYDLVNEPVDDGTSENCLDWQGLSLRAARAVREIDPACTLIIEPPQWGSAQGFTGFQPLELTNVVYSFHFYNPTEFTHQGVFGPSEPIRYPGKIAGAQWDKAAIEAAMAPAIEFARRHRVHMYVGEFSAIRWAPGAEQYLTDLIDTIESHGWDWSYHAFREWDGWSVEHGADKNSHERAASPTPRQQVLLRWMKQNQRAR